MRAHYVDGAPEVSHGSIVDTPAPYDGDEMSERTSTLRGAVAEAGYERAP
jgi:hypothetical protein